ncbi:glycosyltransferase [Mastigocoleus testarum]|uniref:Glycosyl transferase family 1 n=1 Tax=Mastigocoleus testarum BC008 TaxID=371196 RepID=A0A0V7ZS94_9CYAN|nr:glycosyltransferase [Mastigocoleus testarum]KST67355.1 hypothetical protein BC008_29610 [Mastigocoleus testarum BC008]
MINKNWAKSYPLLEDITEESLDDNSSLKKILNFVEENKQIIDFGCATGYLANLLNRKGCTVTGVEINPDAAKIAEQHCEEVIVADLDVISITEALPNQKFDVAIFGDVLEHLRNPWQLLAETKNILKPNGYVVASIPNIAHGAIRLALLQGKFEYSELGILDNTHLRFFTRKTIEELFDNSGYLIKVTDTTTLPIFTNDCLVPQVSKDDFNLETVQKIEADSNAQTVQFIIKAVPSSVEERYALVREQHSKLIEREQKLLSQVESVNLELEQTQDKLERSQFQLEQTQTQLEQSQSQLEQKRTELERSQCQLEQIQDKLERSQLQLQQAHGKLEGSQNTITAMETSKFWLLRKLWFKFRHTIGLRDDNTSVHQSLLLVGSQSDAKSLNSSSNFWQKTRRKSQKLVRFAKDVRKRLGEREERLGRRVALRDLPLLVKNGIKLYKQQEIHKQQKNLDLESNSPSDLEIPQPLDIYDTWLGVNQWNERSQKHLKNRLQVWETKLPKISVIMPAYNSQIEFLESAIKSVVNQVYDNWELCIADDYSTNPEVRATLNKWTGKDSRIKVIFRTENGNISAATNSAASIASGEFIAFLDHDDELTPDALGEVALYLAEHPETDFLYSDDDKIDTQGRRFSPQFKPDWSPELLLSYMYMSHLCVVRCSIFKEVGGLRLGYEGSQDYDFALRATEIAREVKHLPLVLYHWRAVPGSTATSGSAKPASFVAGEKALQETLQRRGISGSVYHPEWAVKAGCGIFEYQFPNTGSSVTIVIPTKNKLNLLQTCLNSLEKTTYENYQVVVIDNESDDPETLAYLEQIPHKVLHIGNQGAGFNFAAINNRAVEGVDSDYVLFLNNDTEVISPQWLSQMMGFAQLQGVGAVGARLLYPDGKIQHAGVVHGLYHGSAGPAFKTAPEWDFGYLAYAKVNRNYSAVTAACLLTPRTLFLQLGGFDEQQFAVAYNDVDYCYRLVEEGYRCVYCPTAELIHYEGVSRGFVDNPKEPATFKRKYADKVDRWYSPHLSLNNEQFAIQPRKVVMGSVKPIKALMFTHNLNWEGAPSSQYELTVKLKETGIIQPIVYSPQDGPLRKNYEEKGIPVFLKGHPLQHVTTDELYQQAIFGLGEFIQGLGIELVYANTLQTFYAIAAAERLGIPSIWNVRESEPWQTYFNSFGREIAARALECFRFPYRIVFVADATRNRYLPLNSHHNFTVVHNGLNLERLDLGRLDKADRNWTREKARKSLNVADEEIALLLLGTVCERKGQQDLVLALEKIPEELFCQLKVFIVGDRPGPYSDRLKEIMANLPDNLQNRVAIISETPDTATYYNCADIFVLTSRIESFPRVILEAMAYGLPIITTPVFGVKEQVQTKINAIVYEPGQFIELANAIVSLVKDKDMRERLAKNSRHVLNCLNNFEDMARSYSQIFQEAYLSK